MRPTSPLFRSLSSRAAAVALLATTLLAACGGDDNGSGPSTPEPQDPQPGTQETMFAVENLSSQDAYYVYIKDCGAASWGSDRLGATRILDVNEVITWTVNEPGCYDVEARTSTAAQGGQKKATYQNVNVVAGQTTTVTIRDANWAAMQ
ncbi:MAG TPA: hypothetical protein VFY20_05525 [Gemmatimonadales bacterium]|nr:hypothetical protein [Gemmatimonadales bacterium]